jgi:hypothetical protein
MQLCAGKSNRLGLLTPSTQTPRAQNTTENSSKLSHTHPLTPAHIHRTHPATHTPHTFHACMHACMHACVQAHPPPHPPSPHIFHKCARMHPPPAHPPTFLSSFFLFLTRAAPSSSSLRQKTAARCSHSVSLLPCCAAGTAQRGINSLRGNTHAGVRCRDSIRC